MSTILNQSSSVLTTSNHGNSGSSGGGRVGGESGTTKKYRKINLDLILSATTLTRSSKETHEAYLARVTHLHLQNKNIKRIDALDLCTNLKVRTFDSLTSFIFTDIGLGSLPL